MGHYVRAPDERDLQEWLSSVGRPCYAEKAYFADQEMTAMLLAEASKQDEVIIACVENQGFKAGLILDGEASARRTSLESDDRPVTYWLIKKADLRDLGYRIDQILGEAHTREAGP